MSLEAKIIAYIVVLFALWAGYQYVGHRAVVEYKKEVAIEQAKVDRAQQDKYDKLAQEYELVKTKRQDNVRTIIKEVEKIVSNPVYSVDCLDAGGLQLLNSAITGKNTSQLTPALQGDTAP